MWKICLIVTVLIFVFACSQERSDIKKIMIDYRNPSEMKLSRYISGVKVCRLETTDKNLVGDVLDIELYGNRIYLLDGATNSLHIYDTTGKLVRVFNKVGRGPGEYVRLRDVEVKENGIFLLDYSTQAVLHYDFDMNFIDRTKFDFFPCAFKVLPDGYLFFGERTLKAPDYAFYKVSGQRTDGFLPRETGRKPKYNFGASSVFAGDSDQWFALRYSNYIYSLEGGEMQLTGQLDFKDKTFPEDRLLLSDYNLYDPDFSYLVRNNMYQVDSCLWIDYFYNKKRFFACYDMRTEKVETGEMENDLLPDFRFFPRWLRNRMWIDCVNADAIVSTFPWMMEKYPCLNGLEEGDNPVLVLYVFK